MKAKVICFASAKGGTGKTVISATFAHFLSALNKKVLLIDADADTNGLTIFYLDKMISAKKKMVNEEISVCGIFEADERLPTPFRLAKNVDMIPATYVMEQTSKIDEIKFLHALQNIISRFEGNYDYVFIDAQAGADSYAEIAIGIADEVVILSEYDPVSLAGIDRMAKIFAEIMPYEKRWILYNKVLPDFAKKIGDIRIAERILSPIHWDEAVVRAFALRRLALDTKKGNAYTIAIMMAISSLLGEEIEKELEHWKKRKTEEFREPILKQLAKIEKEMLAVEEAVTKQQHEIGDLKKSPARFFRISLSLFAIFSAYLYIILRYVLEVNSEVSLVSSIVFMGVNVALSFWIRDIREKRIREQEMAKSAQLGFLRTTLDELKYRYRKFRALADSDTETLLEKYDEG